MSVNIFKIIIILALSSSCVLATPIIINSNDIKTTQIELPSGLVVNSADSVFCEAGCDELLPQSNKKKFLLLAAAGIGLLYFRSRCCCETPPITSSPPTTVPPTTLPPATEVPEIPTAVSLIIGILFLKRVRRSYLNVK